MDHDEKTLALAAFLTIDPSEIEENHRNTYTVNPHRTLSGDGPDTIKATAAMLRDRLVFLHRVDTGLKFNIHLEEAIQLHGKKETEAFTKEASRLYEELEKSAYSAEDKMHAGVNALHYVLNVGSVYGDDLRRAFLGLAIEDHREMVDVEDGEYMVLTDSEADKAWEVALDSYLDDCGLLDSLPEGMRGYFDRDAWKRGREALGRGHSLSPYDGDENEETINGTTYYIYRTN